MPIARIHRLGAALAIAACGVVAVAGSAQQNPPSTTPSPRTLGELALLGNKLDGPAVKAVYDAITANDPQIRTVAARMSAVTAYSPFAVPITVALERESDAIAATEQIRALLMIRGADALASIEPRISSMSSGAANVVALWIANNQPERLADLLPKLASRASEQRSELIPSVPIALKKFEGRQEPSGRLLRAWLAVSSPESWESMLRTLVSEPGGAWRDAVVIEALASKATGISDATVWILVEAVARNRPVSSAVIDAAIADARVDEAGEPTWPRLGRELLARHAGRQTPDRSALIAAEGGKHASDAYWIARLPQATNQEKAALKTLLGKSYPSPSSAAAEPTIPQGGSVMRTIPALWPGLAKSLFEAAKCKLDRTPEFGIVSVVYRPDGRLAELAVEGTQLKSECVQAMTALARLTLEHQTRKPAPGTPEFLVLPITTEYVDCADREPREFTEPGRVGQNIIEPPRKVRDVRPTYPPALQRQRVSGAVILEGVISTTGCVSEVSVLKGVAPAMDFAALRAVSSWLFTPTLLDGKPVPVIMTVTVNFEIG